MSFLAIPFFNWFKEVRGTEDQVSEIPLVLHVIKLTEDFLKSAKKRGDIASFDPQVRVRNDCEDGERKAINYRFHIRCDEFEFRQKYKGIIRLIPDAPVGRKMNYDFSIEINHRQEEVGGYSEDNISVSIKTGIGSRKDREPVSFSMEPSYFSKGRVGVELSGFFEQTAFNIKEIGKYYQLDVQKIKKVQSKMGLGPRQQAG